MGNLATHTHTHTDTFKCPHGGDHCLNARVRSVRVVVPQHSPGNMMFDALEVLWRAV